MNPLWERLRPEGIDSDSDLLFWKEHSREMLILAVAGCWLRHCVKADIGMLRFGIAQRVWIR